MTRHDGYDHYNSLLSDTDEMIGELAVKIVAAAKAGDKLGAIFILENTEPVPLRVNLRFIESSIDGE